LFSIPGCKFLFTTPTKRVLIQSIDYGSKTIEVYYVSDGALVESTINVSIFSKNERGYKKYADGNIFYAYADHFTWEKINIRLTVSEGIPVLEVYCFRLKGKIQRKEETIDGINVVYINIDKEDGYEFTGYDIGWGKGSFKTVLDCLLYNYREHKDEVGAKNPDQYLQKAKTFLKKLNKATCKGEVDGVTGVIRYEKNGEYVDIDQNDYIISYGKLKV
jgi:hypothetical protein